MDQFIVDIGNTSIKSIIYRDNQYQEVHRFDTDKDFLNYIEKNNLIETSTIISSVRSVDSTIKLASIFNHYSLLSYKTFIPIKNTYSTPKTLGNDRLANVIFANHIFPKENNLVIDIGTCIKFDFINDQEEYLGGSISLGFSSRYKALHNLTDNLPLLNNETTTQLIGIDTTSSIASGVYLGMLAEIRQFITEYESFYDKVNIFLTGGDLSYFENKELSQKNSIFVDSILTLKGLKVILDYNE